MPLFFYIRSLFFKMAFQMGRPLAEDLRYLMDGAGGLGLFCYFSALLGVCIKKSVDEKECTVRKPVFFFLMQFSTLSSQINEAFYDVIRSSSTDSVRSLAAELESLESPSSQDQVYLGALYMRMADFQKVPAQKLASFKQGRELLEQEIEKQPKEVEFRFVRMIIQEQAPAFLNYSGEL